MARRNSEQYLQDRMQNLLRLIRDKKFSEEKLIHLEIEYCYLQRQLNIVRQYKTLRKNSKTQEG